MRRREHWENGMGKRWGQTWVIPHDNAALRSTKGLASRPSHHHSTFAQGVLEMTTGNQANLMRTIKKELATPFCHNRAHLLERERKQRQRRTQRDEFRAHERCRLAERPHIPH